MSNPKIEISADTKAVNATQKVSKSLESVSASVKKANMELSTLTRSMETFARASNQALSGVNKSFTNLFKNANAEADALIQKMQRLKSTMGGGQQAGQSWSGTAPAGSMYAYTTVGGGGYSYPVPAAAAPNNGGGGGGGGNPNGGGGNNPQGGGGGGGGNGFGGIPSWARKVGVGVGAVMAGASAFDGVYQEVMNGANKELRYNASRAGLGADLRNRLVNGDLSDAYLLQDRRVRAQLANITNNTQSAAESSRRTDAIIGGGKAILAGTGVAVAATATGGAGLAAGGAMMAGGAPGFGEAVGAYNDYKYDSTTAISAESVRNTLEQQKKERAIEMHTLQQLQSNGARWSRQFRLFSDRNSQSALFAGGIPSDTSFAGEDNYKRAVREGARFGVSEGEVGSLQEQISRSVGQSRSGQALNYALQAESTWGIDRGVAASMMTRLQSGLGDSKSGSAGVKIDDLIAKGFAKGWKDTKFKEDLASVIVDYSEAKGTLNGEGALNMAGLLMSLAGNNPTALGIANARAGLDAANSFMGGQTSGAFKTLGFDAAGSVVGTLNYDARMEEKEFKLKPRHRGDLAEQLMLESLDVNDIGALRNGGGDPMVRQMFERNGWDLNKGTSMIAGRKATFALEAALPGIVKKYGGLGGLQSAIEKGDTGAIGDLNSAAEIARAETGNALTGLDRQKARKALEALVRFGTNPDAKPEVDEQLKAQGNAGIEGRRAAGGGDSSSGSTTVAQATAFLDVMEKISDPKIVQRMDGLSKSVSGFVGAFEGMARSDINTAEEITKMTGAIQQLTEAVANFNSVNGYWMPPQAPPKANTQ